MSERVSELVQEAEDIREAVHDAVHVYLRKGEGWSTSQVAEFLAFFNGYAGAPNLDTFPDRLRRALNEEGAEDDR